MGFWLFTRMTTKLNGRQSKWTPHLGKSKWPERLQLEVSSGVDNKTSVSSKKTRPAFEQWKQEDQEFKSSLGYMANWRASWKLIFFKSHKLNESKDKIYEKKAMKPK